MPLTASRDSQGHSGSGRLGRKFSQRATGSEQEGPRRPGQGVVTLSQRHREVVRGAASSHGVEGSTDEALGRIHGSRRCTHFLSHL